MAEAVSDSKAQVRDAAKAALKQVGSVIKNPEILAISKIIIDSLSDPEKVCCRMLTYVCSRMLTYAHVRMLTYADGTYADVRMLTYANVC